jgi:uncharacterized protein (TIGR00304 family)
MLMVVGLSLIFFGFLILIWPPEDQGRKAQHNLEYVEQDAKGKKIRGRAVVMIGPIPVVLGSDYETALMMMIIALLAIVVWTVYLRF